MIHWLARGLPLSASPTTIFTVTNLLVGVSAMTGFIGVAGVSAAAVFFIGAVVAGAGVTGALVGAGNTGEVTAGLDSAITGFVVAAGAGVIGALAGAGVTGEVTAGLDSAITGFVGVAGAGVTGEGTTGLDSAITGFVGAAGVSKTATGVWGVVIFATLFFVAQYKSSL